MHRMFTQGGKARLNFSGGPHPPVNMADSMENAGSWTVSWSKEAMGVPKNFKDLLKLGIQNRAQQMCHFFTTIHFFYTIASTMFTGVCGPPDKLSLACTFCAWLWNLVIKFGQRRDWERATKTRRGAPLPLIATPEDCQLHRLQPAPPSKSCNLSPPSPSSLSPPSAP